MYRRIWSSSFTYWRQDAGTKKRKRSFSPGGRTSPCSQGWAKWRPAPNRPIYSNNCKPKRMRASKRAYPPRTTSSLMRCISASKKAYYSCKNTRPTVWASPAFAIWRTTVCLCLTGFANCCPPLRTPIPRPKSRQMPGIFPISPKQRCAFCAIRRHSWKQAHSMTPCSSTRCRIPTNCRTLSYLSLPAPEPLSGSAT